MCGKLPAHLFSVNYYHNWQKKFCSPVSCLHDRNHKDTDKQDFFQKIGINQATAVENMHGGEIRCQLLTN